MPVRVRFAPSPTGYLHIGGARTALYSYLFAKRHKGQFILRVEDTDLERSKKEFEDSQIADLNWLGLIHDEGPDKPGDVGPYRQSERLDIYKKYSAELVEKGAAYPCFCTNAQLDIKKEKLAEAGKAPHYDGTCRNISQEESSKRIADGEEHTIRFTVPDHPFDFKDHVRGNVGWPIDMVGDFVIMRSNGMPTYNYCCTVDDWLMKITHVIRAEDHLNNTLRQLMIYEALGAEIPEFAHVSLLIGKDRQKLSKRHGATSVSQYQKEHYLPEALLNYLCLLGWSHPEEKDVFNIEDIVDIFDLDRFSKSPAMFDVDKLNYINGQYLRAMSIETLVLKFAEVCSSESPFHKQTPEWKNIFAELIKDKIQNFIEVREKVDEIFTSDIYLNDETKEILSWDSTKLIQEYLASELDGFDKPFISEDLIGDWMNHIKSEMKIKGKHLFMGMRVVLTGKAHGPDLKKVARLTPPGIIAQRISKLSLYEGH
ncbi:MAG: glutamate--tRNA ligase [Epsilonproteobacteria bacterium]|nr:MAG: glutamate--tRNA ligase [Campylobacterota bacterium]RLA65911.1 MAG: glutamate--tRNA ligase [Campylobacterota bacterium]